MHFVTGGFSGATQVAVDLVAAAADSPHVEAILVLRRKSTTEEARVQPCATAACRSRLCQAGSIG